MKILVLVATPEEFDPYTRLDGVKLDSSFGFLSARVASGSHQLTVVSMGIGKVKASFVTTLMLLSFEFDLVINAGLCGTLCNEVPGTLHYCSGYIEHDLVLDSHQASQSLHSVPTCSFLDILQNSACLGEVSPALIATGDKFLLSSDSDLEGQNIQICDMEFAAIAQVVETLHRPLSFLGLKMVSDSGSFDEYKENNIRLSAVLAKKVIHLIDFITLHSLFQRIESSAC